MDGLAAIGLLFDAPHPKLSAWIRDHQERGDDPPVLDQEELDTLLPNLPNLTPIKKQLLLLRAIKKRATNPSVEVYLKESDYPLAWSEDFQELYYHAKELENRSLIRTPESSGLSGQKWFNPLCTITTEGWTYLEETKETPVNEDRGFVAMSFDTSLRPLYDSAIKPGIRDAGYSPHLAGDTHHTEPIDSKVLVDIRESAFVVADMTEYNRNVFFEAGFAKGLGRPVIFTVKESDLSGKYIDTRNFLHVVWTTPEDLREKLKYAIIDVMGRGPHPVPADD